MVDQFDQLFKSLSKGISIGWSAPSTSERFIKRYFRRLISSINYWKVHQGVFQLVDQSDQLLKGSSRGISDGWSVRSTIERFIKGYFSWLISPINYSKVYQRVFQMVDQSDQLLKSLSKSISDGWSVRSTIQRFIKEYFRWLISPINYSKVYQRVFQMVDQSNQLLKGSSRGISEG